MRNTIYFLLIFIILLLGNIIWYFTSEEYRFFVQKVKYPNEIITSSEIIIDDSVLSQDERESILEVLGAKGQGTTPITALDFIESLSTSRNTLKYDVRSQDITPDEIDLQLLKLFELYNLQTVPMSEFLFSITSEYPDPYLEWFSENLSLYSFPTKSFQDVYDIFDVLSFELPISLNRVNNFWSQSFFINMDEDWQDDVVRVVFEYQNKVFWLKIKKLQYNNVRDALSVLR